MEPAVEPVIVQHVRVLEAADRSIGWPANHCKPWAWGNEILVGAHAPYYKVNGHRTHLADFDRPGEVWFARSLDGGATWTRESHPELDNLRRMKEEPVWRGGDPVPQDGPIDFAGPDTIVSVLFQDFRYGNSCYCVSHDRGRTWSKRYALPRFGKLKSTPDWMLQLRRMDGHAEDLLPGMFGRSDYDIESASVVNLFVTVERESGHEGRVVVLRTEDGGLTWNWRADVTQRDLPHDGFDIMPSTLRLSRSELLMTVRREITDRKLPWPEGNLESRVDAYGSIDNGVTWSKRSTVTSFRGCGSSPPSMVQLRDGRVLCTYAVRDDENPKIAARLSDDGGRTWSDELTIRTEPTASWDIGYVRSAVRADGAVVTAYYWGDRRDGPRYLAATIWRVADAPAK